MRFQNVTLLTALDSASDDSRGSHNSSSSSSPLFEPPSSAGNTMDHSGPSLLLDKMAGNSSRSDPSSIPSSIALPVWQDNGRVAIGGHHRAEVSRPSDQASSGPVNPADSKKIYLRSDKTLYSFNHSGLSSPSSPSSPPPSSAATPSPVLLTSPTSYWWRPHFTKLPYLKHNYDVSNFRAINGSLADAGRSNPKKSTSAWVIIVGSGVGVGLVCIIICALFACTNYFFFPPRRKQQLPIC